MVTDSDGHEIAVANVEVGSFETRPMAPARLVEIGRRGVDEDHSPVRLVEQNVVDLKNQLRQATALAPIGQGDETAMAIGEELDVAVEALAEPAVSDDPLAPVLASPETETVAAMQVGEGMPRADLRDRRDRCLHLGHR